MLSAKSELTGGCLCRAIRFSCRPAEAGITACHCIQCRQWSGHVWAAIAVSDLQITGEDDLRWYRASDIASRGFCRVCGSSLFWKRDGSDVTDAAAGCLDAPTGLELQDHIYTAFKGDYYTIADGLPQEE